MTVTTNPETNGVGQTLPPDVLTQSDLGVSVQAFSSSLVILAALGTTGAGALVQEEDAQSSSGVPAANNTYVGHIVDDLVAGVALAQWAPVYVGAAFGLRLADANGAGTFPCIGLAVGAVGVGVGVGVLDDGVARNDAWAWVPGRIYVSNTGTLVQTPGTNPLIVGYAIATNAIRVRPSFHVTAGN